MSRVIIIGAGLAGLTAAINASDNGADVDLISPDFSERSQSVMAMGGINASLNTKGENDSPQQHFDDTMNGGCMINDSKAVLSLTSDAPKIVDWLSRIGTSFTRDDEGNVDLRNFGGQKKKRTAYAGARTGKQIVTALVNECRKKEVMGKVKRHVGWRFSSLILTDRGECAGVVCIHEDTGEFKSFRGDAVIMATGGLNSLFGKTVGSLHNDGYATAKVFTQGVQLSNLEMIQYHPTTVKTPAKRMLITEAARGEGGKLYVIKDNQKWFFMKEWYPELAELMPRDVVSRSIYKASDGGKKEVFLDITHLDEETIKIKLDEVYEVCMQYLNLNPVEEPIPVFPGVHYFMGGIRTDENHQTNIRGLYAAGECSCQYHGANRLGGNSLLGAIHGGCIAAENIVLDDYPIEDELIDKALESELQLLESWKDSQNGIPLKSIENQLASIMNDSLGIYRNQNDLLNALKEIENLNQDINTDGLYYDYVKIKSLLMLAKSCILSANGRKESRGAHQRLDYPDVSDDYKKTTCINFDGEIKISFEGFDE